MDGINVLSLEDIYLRKIYAVSGLPSDLNQVGKERFSGGRQVARDLFDLYHLSVTHERLSRFARNHCEPWLREGLITWYATFNRLEMKMELNELIVKDKIEFSTIEKHFRKEIDALISGALS